MSLRVPAGGVAIARMESNAWHSRQRVQAERYLMRLPWSHTILSFPATATAFGLAVTSEGCCEDRCDRALGAVSIFMDRCNQKFLPSRETGIGSRACLL